tara:strand:- start:868 stop:1476 length:609 start_codon:yes stop_codon:yes gene_type:complete
MMQWDTIKSLAVSKIGTGSAIWIFIVPAIAKVSEMTGATLHSFDLEIIAPQSMLLLYFSSLAFFLGTLIYQIMCPSLIKDTNNYLDFEHSGQNEFNLSQSVSKLKEENAQEFINQIKKDIEMPTPDEISKSKVLLIDAGETRSKSTLIRPDDLPKAYWITRNFHNQAHSKSRSLSCLLFGSGFLMLSYILITNLIIVIKHII